MLLPLILAVLDEILIRQRHSAGVVRRRCSALLVVRAVLPLHRAAGHRRAVVVVVCLVVLVAAALVADPAELRRLAPHAAKGLGVGAGRGRGAAGLAGLVRPRRARRTSRAWSGPTSRCIGRLPPVELRRRAGLRRPAATVFLALGGYEGTPLASAAYLGWRLPRRAGRRARSPSGATAASGSSASLLVAVRRSARCGARHGQWVPARLFDAHARARERDRAALHGRRLPGRGRDAGHHPRPRPRAAARLARARSARSPWPAVALVPMAAHLRRRLPFAMRPVILPRWYADGGPDPAPGAGAALVPGAVLGHPVRHGVAGGEPHALQPGRRRGAPGRGVPGRARRRAGFTVLTHARLRRRRAARPTGTPAAVRRRAPRAGRVAGQHRGDRRPTRRAPLLQQGHDPTYAAAFMTAALGRLPIIQPGAWVWNDVRSRRPPRAGRAAGHGGVVRREGGGPDGADRGEPAGAAVRGAAHARGPGGLPPRARPRRSRPSASCLLGPRVSSRRRADRAGGGPARKEGCGHGGRRQGAVHPLGPGRPPVRWRAARLTTPWGFGARVVLLTMSFVDPTTAPADGVHVGPARSQAAPTGVLAAGRRGRPGGRGGTTAAGTRTAR